MDLEENDKQPRVAAISNVRHLEGLSTRVRAPDAMASCPWSSAQALLLSHLCAAKLTCHCSVLNTDGPGHSWYQRAPLPADVIYPILKRQARN